MKYIALLTLGCFMVFQSCSWGRVVTVWNPNREMHYSQESRDALNQLVASTSQTQGIVYDSKRRAEITPECEQTDWVCLVAWAERKGGGV